MTDLSATLTQPSRLHKQQAKDQEGQVTRMLWSTSWINICPGVPYSQDE